MNPKSPESRKVDSEIKNIEGTICTTLGAKRDRGVTYSRQWGHRGVFQKNRIVGVWRRGRDYCSHWY